MDTYSAVFPIDPHHQPLVLDASFELHIQHVVWLLSHPLQHPRGPSHDVASDESHTLANHQQTFKRVDTMGRAIEMQYPTHIASCPSFLRWTLPLLRHRITPNYSFGQVIVLTAYSWILIYATLYKSKFFSKYSRVGWVSIDQLPFVLAYGAKNNIVGTVLGVGYGENNPNSLRFSS